MENAVVAPKADPCSYTAGPIMLSDEPSHYEQWPELGTDGEPGPSSTLSPSADNTRHVKVKQEVVEVEQLEFALARPVKFTREVVKYKVLWATSPFEFCVIEASDEYDCFNLSGGLVILQGIAEKLNLHSERPPKHLMKNKIYVIFDDKKTNQWHRCRLLDFNESTGLVFYFDGYLRMENVPLQDLRETPRTMFSHAIAPVYRCHLYDVIPKDGSHTWDDETLIWFSNQILARDGIWRGLQMSWNEKRVCGYNNADLLIDVGMILFEDTRDVWDGMSVNFKLVKFRKARSIGIGGTYFSNLFFCDSEPMFSLQGAPEIPLLEWFKTPFPYDAGSRLPQIGISYVRRLDCIYVYLVNKHKDLKAMEHFMEDQMEPSKRLPMNQLIVGTPVLCWSIVEKNCTTKKRVRGVVLQVIKEDQALVLQVDTGRSLILKIQDMYVMPKRLVQIPAFVHRIHLTQLHPVSSIPIDVPVTQLLPLLGDLFMKQSAYFAFRSNPTSNADIVALNNVHESLLYFPDQQKWLPLLHSNTRRFDVGKLPLMENYFYSFGVDIKIVDENISEDRNELWKVVSLSELIATRTNMFQLIRENEMDKKKYYRTILSNYSV